MLPFALSVLINMRNGSDIGVFGFSLCSSYAHNYVLGVSSKTILRIFYLISDMELVGKEPKTGPNQMIPNDGKGPLQTQEKILHNEKTRQIRGATGGVRSNVRNTSSRGFLIS